MRKVAIVTDSTAYISKEVVDELEITVVPLTVLWDDKSYLDGVDITPTEFYSRLSTAKTMPSTSQPSPHAFLSVYKPLLDAGLDIVSIHISAKLSGTYASAIQAKEMLETDRVTVIDSEVTAMALGYSAILAARAARDGQSAKSVARLAKESCANSGAIFIVNTLEFLHRGGRIGGVSAFLGTALDLKPILALKDGKIEAVEKVRTRTKSLDRAIKVFLERCEGKKGVHLGMIHANSETDTIKVLEKIRQSLPEGFIIEDSISDVSPVIGTHAGPGTVGISYTMVN